MAKVNGNKVLVFINDVAIGCLTGCSINIDKEEIITTCKDNDGAKTVLDGGTSWSIDFDGNLETAASVGLDDLIDLLLAGTEITVRFSHNAAGGLYLTGTGKVMNLKWDGPLNAASKFSGKISPTSALSKGTHT